MLWRCIPDDAEVVPHLSGGGSYVFLILLLSNSVMVLRSLRGLTLVIFNSSLGDVDMHRKRFVAGV